MGTTLVKANGKKTSANGKGLKSLTSQAMVFVLEMLKSPSMNSTEAARAAGYRSPSQAANKLMKKPAIRAALAREQKKREERCQLSGDRVLEEVSYCALRDPIDLCDENGNIIVNSLKDIPERMRRCIDGIEVTTYTNPETGEVTQTLKLKLVSKAQALKMAMDHFGLNAPTETNVNFGVIPDFDLLWQGRPENPSNVVDGSVLPKTNGAKK